MRLSADGCTPKSARRVGPGITGDISWSGPSRQCYRPPFHAVSLSFSRSQTCSSHPVLARARGSLLPPFASFPFHPHPFASFALALSSFVRGRIMVSRSIVLRRPGRRRQIELEICDSAVCKVVRRFRGYPFIPLSPSSSEKNPLLLISRRNRHRRPSWCSLFLSRLQ